MEFAAAPVSALLCAGLCFGQGFGQGFGQDGAPRNSGIVGPEAVATNADVNFCFARIRGLDPSHLPPAYLAIRLRVAIVYRNPGTRPVILPLERTKSIYYGLQPERMKVFREGLNVFERVTKVMTELPPNVSPNSPVTPANNIFGVIPAGGEMTPPLLEEITIPADPKGLFTQSPNLRGHRVYVKVQYKHREISAALQADLSDRWSAFGVLWTGALTTNLIAIDVPTAPQAAPCQDIYTPAHPAVGVDDKK